MTDIPNKILYEDEHIVGVEKLAGELVVKDRFGREPESNILIYKVSQYLREKGHVADAQGRDLFPLHRLDRATSGVVVFAKDSVSHAQFSKLFEGGAITKTYWLFTAGLPWWDRASIELPLKRAEGKKGRGRSLININDGNRAVTHFTVKETFGDIAWVEAQPETGKLHQIRVHAKALGVPLLHDTQYEDTPWTSLFFPETKLNRFPLHARYLEFVHPITNKPIKISCALASDMHALLDALKKKKQAELRAER